jgi:hypothetical protein
MSNNPINLALRFILEILALVALAYWGWTQHTGLGHILWTLALPILAAVVWGIFRVPNDPGKAPVAVPGAVRLVLELVIFGAAVMALYKSDLILLSNIFGLLVMAHYLLSYDRIIWLIKHNHNSAA